VFDEVGDGLGVPETSPLPVAVAARSTAGWLTCRGRRCAGWPTCTSGSARTDARDACVIAEAARTVPHTLRRVDIGEEALPDSRW
jgi:hypothetical protein